MVENTVIIQLEFNITFVPKYKPLPSLSKQFSF
jgi:hypothetical protein